MIYTPGWGVGGEKTRVVMSGGVVTSIGNLVHGSPDKAPLERTPEVPSRMTRSRSRSVDQSPGSDESRGGKRRKDVSRELHLDSSGSRKITPLPRAKDLPQISDSHRVEDFKVYFIMKAGVNTGLSDEGMVNQEVYHRKIFDKFLDTVVKEICLHEEIWTLSRKTIECHTVPVFYSVAVSFSVLSKSVG